MSVCYGSSEQLQASESFPGKFGKLENVTMIEFQSFFISPCFILDHLKIVI